MTWLYFNQYSISSLVQLILSGIVTIYFLTQKNKSPRAWYRSIAFIFLTGFFVATFFTTCIYAPWGIYFVTAQYGLLLISVTLFVQFMYHLPKKVYHVESKTTFMLGGFISFATIAYLVWKLIENQAYLPFEHLLTNGIILFGFLWIIIVGVRHALRLPHISDEEFAELTGEPHKTKKQLSKESWQVSTLFIVGVLPTLSNLLYYGSIISQTSYLLVANTIYLIFLFLFILAYFEISPEPSSLSKKMVGISLTTMLAALSIVGSITMLNYSTAFHSKKEVKDTQTIAFIPIKGNQYRIEEKKFTFDSQLGFNLRLKDANSARINLNFEFPFAGKVWHDIFIGSNGIVSFETGISTYNYFEFVRDIPKIAPLYKDLNPEKGGGVFFKQTEDTMIITWNQVPDFGKKNSNTVQLTLIKDGSFFFTYLGISQVLPGYVGIHLGNSSTEVKPIVFSSQLPQTSSNRSSVYEDFYEENRNYIHEGAVVFIVGICILTLFILIIFPLFFRSTVTRPLKDLLTAVRRVDEGDLTVSVQFKSEDEIGFITRSFNEMVKSIRDGKQSEILRLQAEKEEEIMSRELQRKAKELEFARNVQLSMLPKTHLNTSAIEVFGKMRSASEVGGDYYDIIKVYENRYCIAVGDATGHGVAAGLVVAMIKMALVNSIRSFDQSLTLKQLFENLNRSLKECLPDRGMGMALAITILNLDTMTADVAAVGMPFPFWCVKSTDTISPIVLTGPPLGYMSELVVTKNVIPLQSGDALIFHSDGYTERLNPKDELWEDQRFTDSLKNAYRTSSHAQDIVNRIEADCDEFAKGRENTDDMTMVVIRVK